MYVISDLVTDHTTCKGWRGPGNPNGPHAGEPYWRPTAAVGDIIQAKAWAEPDSIITEHSSTRAYELVKAKRLPAEEIQNVHVA